MNMGGMGEAKLDGTPFNVLMQQAVKLKTHVHKIDRVRFDAWPKFYQNTAFVKDEHKKERTLAYDDRMACARAYKEKGDAAFKSGKMIEACNEYEACGGLFKWATTLREDCARGVWKTRTSARRSFWGNGRPWTCDRFSESEVLLQPCQSLR